MNDKNTVRMLICCFGTNKGSQYIADDILADFKVRDFIKKYWMPVYETTDEKGIAHCDEIYIDLPPFGHLLMGLSTWLLVYGEKQMGDLCHDSVCNEWHLHSLESLKNTRLKPGPPKLFYY